jgi:hypothetical protein
VTANVVPDVEEIVEFLAGGEVLTNARLAVAVDLEGIARITAQISHTELVPLQFSARKEVTAYLFDAIREKPLDQG